MKTHPLIPSVAACLIILSSLSVRADDGVPVERTLRNVTAVALTYPGRNTGTPVLRETLVETDPKRDVIVVRWVRMDGWVARTCVYEELDLAPGGTRPVIQRCCLDGQSAVSYYESPFSTDWIFSD